MVWIFFSFSLEAWCSGEKESGKSSGFNPSEILIKGKVNYGGGKCALGLRYFNRIRDNVVSINEWWQDPRNRFDYYFYRGEALYYLDRYEEAIRALDSIISNKDIYESVRDEEMLEVYFLIGILYLQEGLYQQAIDSCGEVEKSFDITNGGEFYIDPFETADLFYYIGKAYFHLGLYQQSAEYFSKVFYTVEYVVEDGLAEAIFDASGYNIADVYYLRGVSYFLLGNYTQAIVDFHVITQSTDEWYVSWLENVTNHENIMYYSAEAIAASSTNASANIASFSGSFLHNGIMAVFDPLGCHPIGP